MGYDNNDGAAHRALVATRKNLPKEEVFRQQTCHPDMSPLGLTYRESRDSSNHPNSNAIFVALDETGSMKDIPHMLATEEFPHFMALVEEGDFIDSPQVLFSALGDAEANGGSEIAPFQIGQFESDGRKMDHWLTKIHLEGKGGGNGGESYDLAIYAAARHTVMDCYEKRGRKGYLFVTGDEPHLGRCKASVVKRVFGTDIGTDIPMAKLVTEAGKKFHIFFLIPDQQRRTNCERPWRDVLGDNVICMEDPKDTCAVMATLIGLTEGRLADLDAAAKKLEELGRSATQVGRIIRAVEPYASSIGIVEASAETEPGGQTAKKRKK